MDILSVNVETDAFTAEIGRAFDFDFTGLSTFPLPDFTCPKEFSFGIIVGSSGSGKTQLLKKHFNFTETPVVWDRTKAVISHFENPQVATEKVFAVGLSSIPTLCRPYHVLSNGEQFRADMARRIQTGAVIDEFTSVVNRETAKSLSVAISKYIRKNNLKNIVFASCHKDIINWLQPDWVFDCDNQLKGQQGLFLNDLAFNKENRVAKIEIF
jgi:ABC-type ATPase with predicted acetyltransferase domain